MDTKSLLRFLIWFILLIRMEVSAQLAVNFQVLNDCQFTKRFVDQSTTSAGDSIKSRLWTFGDGNDSSTNLVGIDYRYRTSGTVTVKLHVVTWNGDTGSATQSVIIKPPPVANFKFSFNCIKNQIIFVNTTRIDTPFTIVEEFWDFDGGDTLRYTGKRDTIIYNPPATGPRTIRLTTYSSNGCPHTAVRTLVYPEKPDDLLSLTIPKACPNRPVTIPIKWLVPASYIKYVTFYFSPTDTIGTDRVDTLDKFTYTLKTPGKIPIRIVMLSEFGCTHVKDNDSIEVLQNPNSLFDFENGCTLDSFFFADQSNGNGTTITSRLWQFGDNRFSTQQYPIHRYTTSGSFTVSLTTTNQLGCTDVLTKTITVPSPLIPYITHNINNVCINTPIQFDVLGMFLDTALSVRWDFGDGNVDSVNLRPTHAYARDGSYRVRVTITFRNGCIWNTQTSAVIMVTRNLRMFSMVSPLETSFDFPVVQFRDSTPHAVSWTWDAGDGTQYTQPNVVHTYKDTGTYKVRIMVSDPGGCADTIEYSVRINPVWKFRMPNAFSPDGNNRNEVFRPVGDATYALEYHMRIYSRWGQLIFDTKNFKEGWDGTFWNQGNPCTDGMYIYIIELLDETRTDHIFKGNVFLLRNHN